MAIDSTVGGANSNSYVSRAEADAYFADSLDSAKWSALTNGDSALVTATRYMESLTYIGAKASTTQALQFPRTGLTVSSSIIPLPVKQSTYELALEFASNSAGIGEVDDTTEIKVGPITLKRKIPDTPTTTALPVLVSNLLAPFLSGASSGSGFTLVDA